MDIILEKVKECKKDTLFRLLQYSLFEESVSDHNDMKMVFFFFPISKGNKNEFGG